MKRIVIGVAAIAIGGLLASNALTPRQVGVLVSDAAASTIRGGCAGEDDYTCSNNGCSGGTVSKAGSQFASWDVTTTVKWCDTADHNCGSGFTSKSCNSGPG
jgi:hypothetical protein